MNVSRRSFLQGTAAAAAVAAVPTVAKGFAGTAPMSCPFRLSVINDEISQDFEHDCEVAAHDFGLSWIELRGMWKKNIADLNDKEVDDVKKILAKYKLRVTDIASPLFKVDWPGAPPSKERESHSAFNANVDLKKQDEVLARCIAIAKALDTDRIRCFDFWRLEDQKPFRAAMDQKLREAAEVCEKNGMILLLENEMSCNTATGAEAARTLGAVKNKNFMLNWDPGNAVAAGEVKAFPGGYDLLPKHRIGHCHCKDTVLKPGGGYEWAPVGGGVIDWAGQFRALVAQGYHHAVSLETHWHGGGTPEESTRISMRGLKSVLSKDGLSC
ncbi:MAG: sugar phosphate isomerase/epimerase family protein [Acidobacteriota bacterium]